MDISPLLTIFLKSVIYFFVAIQGLDGCNDDAVKPDGELAVYY